MVGRQAECLKVAAILDGSPLLGKKAREFPIWREAVELWITRGGADPELERLATALRALRRDTASSMPCFHNRRLPCGLPRRLRLRRGALRGVPGSPSFTINLRADDGPLLRMFHERFALGHLADIPASGGSRAAMSWRVGRLSDLRHLADLFDEYPPRGRAARVYAPWRELVRLEPRTGSARHGWRQRYAVVVRSSLNWAKFSKPTQLERSQSRCLDGLHGWAATLDGPGNTIDYNNWRRSLAPDAPTRNSIAAAFGLARGLDRRGHQL